MSILNRYFQLRVLFSFGILFLSNSIAFGMGKSIFDAAMQGDLFRIKVSVFSEDLNQQDNHGRTPLFLSVARGNEKVAEALIVGKASVDQRARTGFFHGDGLSPLEAAAYKGDLALIKILLDAGAHVNQADHRSWTPLLWATFKGHQNAVLALLKAGAQACYQEKIFGYSSLYWAVMNGQIITVGALLKAGADPSAVEKCEGQTPLHQALLMKRLDLAQLLIDAGADVKIKDKNGKSPQALKLAIELEQAPL